jgi:hypothetical protein
MTTADILSVTSAVRAPEEYRGLTVVVPLAESLARVQELQAFVKEVMVEGVDFGTIPGVRKPSLWQPGAQKLAELYGLVHKFVDTKTVEDWDKPFFFYRRGCVLTSRRDGSPMGDGIGSCNSMEDRYAWRWLWPSQVRGLDVSGVKQKKTSKGILYRFPNDDLFSLVNTIEKMACKRAYVHAVTAVTRSSGIFTQDAEDMPEEQRQVVDGGASWDDDEPQDGGSSGPEPGAEKVSAFLAALASAKDDEVCKAIGRYMVVAHRAGQISDKQRLAVQDVIGARREALASKAQGAA